VAVTIVIRMRVALWITTVIPAVLCVTAAGV